LRNSSSIVGASGKPFSFRNAKIADADGHAGALAWSGRPAIMPGLDGDPVADISSKCASRNAVHVKHGGFLGMPKRR
jgi:hypothetical protein